MLIRVAYMKIKFCSELVIGTLKTYFRVGNISSIYNPNRLQIVLFNRFQF